MNKLPKGKKAIVIVAVFWGLILAIGGFISGNQALTAPDFNNLAKLAIKEKISPNAVDCLIESNRKNFQILEFAETNECSNQYTGVANYQCVSPDMLEDSGWLRNISRRYKHVVVFGDSRQKSLIAAATLLQHGHKARMLDTNEAHYNVKGQPVANNLQKCSKTTISQSQAATMATALNSITQKKG